MASATSDYLVNVSCRPFIRPWVTGPLVPTSSSLTLPVPPGTTSKGGLTVVRNPSAAYRIPRTERRSQVEEDARGYTVFAARSPRYADVSQSIPGLKGIEVLNTDIRAARVRKGVTPFVGPRYAGDAGKPQGIAANSLTKSTSVAHHSAPHPINGVSSRIEMQHLSINVGHIVFSILQVLDCGTGTRIGHGYTLGGFPSVHFTKERTWGDESELRNASATFSN